MGILGILFVDAGENSPVEMKWTVGTVKLARLRGDDLVIRDLVEFDADRPVFQGQMALPSLSEADIIHSV